MIELISNALMYAVILSPVFLLAAWRIYRRGYSSALADQSAREEARSKIMPPDHEGEMLIATMRQEIRSLSIRAIRLSHQEQSLMNQVAELKRQLWLANEANRQLNLAFARISGASQEGPFSDDEIRTLVSLCHPDKHNGKESAIRITQRLLELRGRAKSSRGVH